MRPVADDHDIRYVCLSDLHLGEESSLLTALRPDSFEADASRPSAVLVELVACLQHLLDQNSGSDAPTLVLNGDLLELGFGSVAGALETFQRLAELACAPGSELFGDIVFVPGNHDHHLWELARETAFCETIGLNSGHALMDPMHATPVSLEGGIRDPMLGPVLARVRKGASSIPLRVLYPVFAVTDESSGRGVVFHHGHYCEPVYHLMSKARRWFFPEREQPATACDVETENFAWVDFLWSLLGRSGGAGSDMERSFEMLHYPEHVGSVAAFHARRLARSRDLPWIPGRVLQELVIRKVMARVAIRLAGERGIRNAVCSTRTINRLTEFLFGPVATQVREELGHLPEQMTFVMGHTHKPFEAVARDPLHGMVCDVYNSGGWVVDSRDPTPAVGASIILVSEGLEVVSVRLFNDGLRGGDLRMDVRVAAGGPEDPPGEPSRFAAEITRRIRGGTGENSVAPPWHRLGERIREAVLVRRGYLEHQFPRRNA